MIAQFKKRRHVARGWGWGMCQTCRFMVQGKDGFMLCNGMKSDDGERPSCAEVRAKHLKQCPKWKERR
jgi:hypothetical protein